MPDVNSAYSQNLSIAQKARIDTALGNINSGIDNFSTAVSEGFKSASLKITSLFENKDFKKAVAGASGSKSPEEAKANKSAFAGALTFPADLQYYTMFSFKEYKKKDVTAVAKDSSSVVIILPLPANLSETFAVEYATPALGPVIGAAAEGLLAGARNAGAMGAGESILKGITNIPAAAEAGAFGMLKKMGGVGEGAANIGSMALGVAPNPHLAVLFTNVGLRNHKFSYKFAPRSAAELGRLKNIIYNLKHKMLPGLDTSMLFSFPDVVDIKFVTGKAKAPYIIKRCVMESLDVNYSPGGSPAFFKTGDPVMVEISMSFKEMSPFTRDDIPAV
jgi:hypothetical protein